MRNRLVACMVLGLASALSADEKDEIARLKERNAELRVAVYPRPGHQARRLDDINNMRQLVGLLAATSASKFPTKDGALDVYFLCRKGHLEGKNLVVLRSERTGVGPSPRELEREDYAHFPYERWRGQTPLKKTGEVIPLLWDRAPQPDGTRLVGMSTGSIQFLRERELQDLLEKHGQLTLKYSDHGVSFEYPRRFRISEKKTVAGPLLFVDDPATPDKDVVIGIHGKQMPGFLDGMYMGIKKGVRVERSISETGTKETIGGMEAPGKKLVYLREGEETKRVLRFLRINETHSATVSTVLDDDAYTYPKLQSILHSIKIEKAEAKKPAKEVEEEFD